MSPDLHVSFYKYRICLFGTYISDKIDETRLLSAWITTSTKPVASICTLHVDLSGRNHGISIQVLCNCDDVRNLVPGSVDKEYCLSVNGFAQQGTLLTTVTA